MKSSILLLNSLLLLKLQAFSQNTQQIARNVHISQGIHFEEVASFQQLLETARKENKLLFVDCFATWCRPCRYMSDSVFTNSELGRFMNAYFINAKVQMDQTAKDDPAIKNWYNEAKMIDKRYKVDGYPCYLFINAEGELVYKATGAYDVTAFIAKARKALDADEQYFFLLEQYNKGKREPAFLKQLLKAAERQGDTEIISKLKALKVPQSQ